VKISWCASVLVISLGAAAGVLAEGSRNQLAESEDATVLDTQAIVRLIDKWGVAAAQCRAGANDGCSTEHAVLIELDDLGWCFGHESDPGLFFRRWHRCGFESLHPTRP
jgi:hypothetical protein